MRYLPKKGLIEVDLDNGRPLNAVTVRQVSGSTSIELLQIPIFDVQLLFSRQDSGQLTDVVYILQPGHEYQYFEVSVDSNEWVREARVMRQILDGPAHKIDIDGTPVFEDDTVLYKGKSFTWIDEGSSDVLLVSSDIQARPFGRRVWNVYRTDPDETGQESLLVLALSEDGLAMYYGHIVKAQHASIVMPVVE